ncbi:MAG: cytochrome b561 domain-containing protein [Pseudomonadota bacterium]
MLHPIDPDRAHLVGFAVSWHGRLMTLAWGVLAPLAILAARFFKVVPGQDWPRELDNQLWWRLHWMGQSIVLLTTALGIGLVLSIAGSLGVHGVLGYTVLLLVAAQVGMGLLRGTKGGPTAPAHDGSLRGDHYDMTRWRQLFEAAHKGMGYALLLVAVATILLGMWEANAPRWMWVLLAVWWVALLIAATWLQRAGRAIDTYQAIWGPSPEHPGNRRPAPGWAMRRINEQGAADVRRD